MLIIGFFLTAFLASGQEKIKLKGKVLSPYEDLSRIHVINLNTEDGTTTNPNGEFALPVAVNDSIYFSSIQFINRTIVIKEEMLAGGFLEIKLEREMTELAEVVVDDIRLSGHLASDVGKISVKDAERKFQLNMGLAEAIKHDRETHLSGDPKGGLNLTELFGSKKESSASQLKLKELNSEKALVNKSIQLVGNKIFTSDLQLKEHEICNFVYFCASDMKFRNLVRDEKILGLIDYFQKRIVDFRNLEEERTYRQIPG